MGLWNFMSKMVQGKPIFEEPKRESREPGWAPEPSQSASESTFVDEGGKKIIPTVTIEHCKSHINGNHMDVTAWLTNASEFEIELDKMVMIDAKAGIGRRLRPGEGHEVMVYRGVLQTSDHAHKAELYYKIVENGDYFRADYMVEYNRESNGTYTVEEFHPEHIVHDV